MRVVPPLGKLKWQNEMHPTTPPTLRGLLLLEGGATVGYVAKSGNEWIAEVDRRLATGLTRIFIDEDAAKAWTQDEVTRLRAAK